MALAPTDALDWEGNVFGPEGEPHPSDEELESMAAYYGVVEDADLTATITDADEAAYYNDLDDGMFAGPYASDRKGNG